MAHAPLEDIIALLDRHFDEEDSSALEQACALAAAQPLDIDALLAWLRNCRAPPGPKDMATRRLRAALRLPAMPGAPCRPDPL